MNSEKLFSEIPGRRTKMGKSENFTPYTMEITHTFLCNGMIRYKMKNGVFLEVLVILAKWHIIITKSEKYYSMVEIVCRNIQSNLRNPLVFYILKVRIWKLCTVHRCFHYDACAVEIN